MEQLKEMEQVKEMKSLWNLLNDLLPDDEQRRLALYASECFNRGKEFEETSNKILFLGEVYCRFYENTKPDNFGKITSLEHPNIEKISNIGVHDGVVFYKTAEYPATLKKFVLEKNFSKLKEACLDALSGIEHLRDKNICHGAIRLHNIAWNGNCFIITDFFIDNFDDRFKNVEHFISNIGRDDPMYDCLQLAWIVAKALFNVAQRGKKIVYSEFKEDDTRLSSTEIGQKLLYLLLFAPDYGSSNVHPNFYYHLLREIIESIEPTSQNQPQPMTTLPIEIENGKLHMKKMMGWDGMGFVEYCMENMENERDFIEQRKTFEQEKNRMKKRFEQEKNQMKEEIEHLTQLLLNQKSEYKKNAFLSVLYGLLNKANGARQCDMEATLNKIDCFISDIFKDVVDFDNDYFHSCIDKDDPMFEFLQLAWIVAKSLFNVKQNGGEFEYPEKTPEEKKMTGSDIGRRLLTFFKQAPQYRSNDLAQHYHEMLGDIIESIQPSDFMMNMDDQ